ALAGCTAGDGLPGVSMFEGSRPSDPPPVPGGQGEVTRAAADRDKRTEAASPVIADLMARRSVLAPAGPAARLAEVVLSANAGAAAAELRVARLKADARARNWLPSLGPSVTLTSLSSIAAGLMVDQVLLDNGRRKAERAFAAADVEVAAVALAAEMNALVHDGLARRIEADRAKAQAAAAEASAARMAGYARIMQGRADGGLADRSEAQVVAQKLSELRATAARDREAEATAMAELSARTGGAPPRVQGAVAVPAAPGAAVPLSVLRAEGEGRRMVAQARIERAGHLPGLGLGLAVTGDGIRPGAKLGADRMFNSGTGASLQALEATEALAAQRQSAARAESDRRLVAIDRQIAELSARQSETAKVVAETEAVLKLFAEQYQVGRRSLMEVVNLTETHARMSREHAAMPFEVALLRLRAAQERGVLVDGARM
ncbi:MAG TPA: TolC family protein, partial [Paracoccaceae bacterium]|nr:TolC family protein [Paracoccaceae bacterium]